MSWGFWVCLKNTLKHRVWNKRSTLDNWQPRQDSNLEILNQNQVCYQLHYRATALRRELVRANSPDFQPIIPRKHRMPLDSLPDGREVCADRMLWNSLAS